MEKAVARLNSSINQNTLPNVSEIGGEFPITDLKTNRTGLLEICMDGIGIKLNPASPEDLSNNDQNLTITRVDQVAEREFIELKRVKKCTTQKDDVFVLEEFGRSLINSFFGLNILFIS